jgi:hypothetical protein
MSFGEVTLWIIGLFLLICLSGCLEYLICKTMDSVTVLGLVLSLVVEIADAMQEALKFTRPRPILLVVSRSFHRVDRMIHLPLFVVALRRASLVRVA